jgi:hypothetical protein
VGMGRVVWDQHVSLEFDAPVCELNGASRKRTIHHLQALAPSVQVKTCEKPHERTSASASFCDFIVT